MSQDFCLKITADKKFHFPQFQATQCFMCCAWYELLAGIIVCWFAYALLLLLLLLLLKYLQ